LALMDRNMIKRIKIICVAGARPNFMKIAPLMEAMKASPLIEPILVHTGQHYDEKMSKLFFEDLEIPKPDIELEVGSGSHAVQTARIMERFESILIQEMPHLILVVGDVNSTIACALTAAKMTIPIAHVEAGLRSFDRTMPEEINRILTDAISDFLFTTERGAHENLLHEGIPEERIYFVGNVMIDTLLKHRKKAETSDVLKRLLLLDQKTSTDVQVVQPYAVLTLHRPANVDNDAILNSIISAMIEIAKDVKIVFPCHPRTKKRILASGLSSLMQLAKSDSTENSSSHTINNILMTEPMGYLDFLCLVARAKLVLTDSGGIQEETTILGVPCITLRDNTERPITVIEGTNVLVGRNKNRIIEESKKAITRVSVKKPSPELWDGKAAYRIVSVLEGQHDHLLAKAELRLSNAQ
jgi:UDP-N-acetylglucosamine 2-epimerase (non-hydrolysing)